MEINYRPITASDLHFLKELYRNTREEELNAAGWNELQKEKFIEFQFNAQHSHYINTFEHIDFLIIEFKKQTLADFTYGKQTIKSGYWIFPCLKNTGAEKLEQIL